MGMKDHFRHSKKVTRGRRWQVLRMAMLERDGFACVDCGSMRRLEVDHVKPVRTHPELSFSPANLAVRCARCHARKTRVEIGLKPVSPERQAWRELVQNMHSNTVEQHGDTNA